MAILKPITLDHAALTRVAMDFLKDKRCSVVVTELNTANYETPDAIGFHPIGSTSLIECKTSRGDFQADKKKRFRLAPELGMGNKRYFLTPPGIVKPEELPDGWGLLEAESYAVTLIRDSIEFQANREAEIRVLMSVIRRQKLTKVVFIIPETQEAP